MPHSYTYTTEFRDEFAAQRLELLRQRFLWYCGVIIGLSLISLLGALFFAWFGSQFTKDAFTTNPASLIGWVVGAFQLVVYVFAFSWVYRNPQRKERVFRIAFWLIVTTGVLSLLQGPVVAALAVPDSKGTVRVPGITINDNDTAPAPNETATLEDAKPPAADRSTPIPAESAPTAPPAAATSPESSPIADAQPNTDSESDTAPATAPDAKPAKKKSASPQTSAVIVTVSGLWSIFVTHFFACCFLPWTPRESFRPIVPLLALNAVILLFYISASYVAVPIAIVLSPLVAAPGAGICWWRGSKIRDSFTLNVLKGRYSEIKRELVDARRIHESLFPAPFADHAVALDYRYEPMRQIGGDYLYARQIRAPHAPRDFTHVIIVDVTGHGITAALTVNRLHGEIDRQLGERPDATPADILTGLNKYLHHTLASHSVYATAICIRVDAQHDELTWASAGHPPAFIRAADGTVDQLDSTTLVLGACKGDDFDPHQQACRFSKGDSLIAYTDGAIESRNAQGRMLGVAGFRAMIASLGSPSSRPALDPLIRSVDEHRFGPIQDDTLLVEIIRPL